MSLVLPIACMAFSARSPFLRGGLEIKSSGHIAVMNRKMSVQALAPLPLLADGALLEGLEPCCRSYDARLCEPADARASLNVARTGTM
jgi:hypothetical protein